MNNAETEIDKKKNENTSDSNKNKEALSTLKKRLIYFVLFLLVGIYSLYSSKLAHLKLIYNNVLHYTNKNQTPPISNGSANFAFLNSTTIKDGDIQVKMAEKVSPDLKSAKPQDQLNIFKGDYKPETKESVCGVSQSGGAGDSTTNTTQPSDKSSSSTTSTKTTTSKSPSITSPSPTMSSTKVPEPSSTTIPNSKSPSSTATTTITPADKVTTPAKVADNSTKLGDIQSYSQYVQNDEVPSDCNMANMAVKNYFWSVIFNIYEQLCLVNQTYFGMLYDSCSEEVILFIMPIITLFYLLAVLIYCKILVVWFLFSNLSIVWKESILYTILILCVIIPFMAIIMVCLSLFLLIYSVVSIFKVKINKLPVKQDAKRIDYTMAKMFYDAIFTKKRTISFILTLFVILFVQSTIGTPYAMLVSFVIFLIYKEIFFQIPIFKNTTPLELFKYDPTPSNSK
jgi:hypothetical protein